jgi:ubiquinone/menaquinone biosynthesis C-methylase UbiE
MADDRANEAAETKLTGSVALDHATEIVNYFVGPATAIRYATNRPSSHERVLELLQSTLPSLPVERALDVGCGTGHSTQALLSYAETIVGVDSSSEMLAQAVLHPRISYRKGYAESLPFRDEDFDLVSVSSAYHWFDHERFLAEAARVLRSGGWLVLYKAGSTGRPTNQPEFEHWRGEVLNLRYPKVARNNEPLTAARASQFGFVEQLCETMLNRQRHTLEGYVENLLTHSSIIRVVDGGHEPVSVARNWLRKELAPFFPTDETEFTHDARIHLLRRESRL